ncbi:STXA protein, partial [Polyodon spathula]|nr:STXA protein [Polyodon spathula]
MAALGRPFQLGMLYDCRKDRLIPGITLWNPEELQASINKENQPITEFSISTSDSIEDKASALKVDAALKASLLGGLVQVSGAANYYNDTKKSTRQSRVTLQYYTTTQFENLTMNHLAKGKVSHPSVFDDKTATHVVTAVLYGARAYFVFDRQLSSEEKKQEIHGKMELAISKIPTFPMEGQGSIDLKETEKAEVEKFECSFYGDFHLKSNPTTYQDAVKAYSTLPELLGDKGENAVPVKVWLYPLIKLDSRAAKLERNVSDYLVSSAQTVLEEFNKIEMQSNDALKDVVAGTFPEVSEKVRQLKQRSTLYKMNFMRKLSAVLPSIRGGEQEEESLREILKSHEESPFNFKAQHAWLNSKEREINAVGYCLTILKDIHAVSSVNELDCEELNSETENIVCFTFTSLHEPEPYLEHLKNYLETQARKNPERSTARNYLHQASKQWVSGETNLKIRTHLKAFQELVNINREDKKTKFFVASKEDQEFPGACILLRENGSSKYTHFEIPAKPDDPEASAPRNRAEFLKYSCQLTLDPNTAYRELCLSEGNRKVTRRTETLRCPDHPERFDCYPQVLCREGLSGTRCYWEIKCSGEGASVVVTYKGTSRKGGDDSSVLGCNDKSWSLFCSDFSYSAWHNNNETAITAPHSPRIGVYLDFNAGTLSFYGVSDTMTLLHRFQTTFTEPLYPGFWVGSYDSPLTICQLN